MQAGQTIHARYRIEAVLGAGGMGTTYKAMDLQTSRPVAVKVLHLSRAQEWTTLEMFVQEAKLLQQLTHPSIPRYVEYFTIDSPRDQQFVLVQEYIDGETLQHKVEAGWQPSAEEIRHIALQLVDILEYLHGLHPPVVHRDVNPKNIILSPENTVYLVDFGAVQEKMRTNDLEETTIVGTFGYTPFEQFRGAAVPASDFYALGATLLFLLTGKHPSEILTKPRKNRFQDIPLITPRLIRLLNGLLEPVVERRIASAREVRRVLQEEFRGAAQSSVAVIQKTVKKQQFARFAIIEKNRFNMSERLARLIVGIVLIAIAMIGVVFILRYVEFARQGRSPNLKFWIQESLLMVLVSIPFWWFGIKFVHIGLFNTARIVTITFHAQHVQIKDLGKKTTIPLATLERVGLSSRYMDDGQPHTLISFYVENKQPVQIQIRLTPTEGDALMQDLKAAYVEVFEKPLPV
jgi:serine/threonine protein kinase